MGCRVCVTEMERRDVARVAEANICISSCDGRGSWGLMGRGEADEQA